MNTRRDLIPNIVLGVALLGLLIFVGAWFLQGGRASIYGNIALGLAAVALAVYAFLRPEEIKGAITSRQARYGSNTALMTVIFVAILVLINFLSTKQFKRWDLTAEKRFSLAPETVELLKNLDTPVTALLFSTGGGSSSDAKILLDEYRAHSSKFEVETIDPEAQPTLARQYIASDGMLVLLVGDRHVTVSNPTESEITSALLKMIRPVQFVAYLTTGHGERDLDDGGDIGFAVVKAALDRDGYQVKPLLLAVTSTIPSDAGLVIVGGPRVPLQPSEIEVLRAYLVRGGRLLLMIDSSIDTPDRKLGDAGLNSLLGEWGITLKDDLVIDLASSLQTDPRVLIANEYGYSPITDKLGNVAAAFPLARSIVLTQTPPANVSLTALVQTSEQSWGAIDLETVAQAMSVGRLPGPTAQDPKGPLTIAASATNSQTGARLVVFGSSYLAVNQFSRWPGNVDLFLNGVNWLAEQESQLNIRPKPFDTRRIIPSVGLTFQVFGISVILLPLAVLILGVIVWTRRRS